MIKRVAIPVLCLGLVSSLAACVYDDEPPRRLAPDPKPYTPPEESTSSSSSSSSGGTGSSSGSTTTTPSNAPSPMLVEVDSDQTMNAVGGEGVGVFIEYSQGGHWHIWWTCDTTQTSQSCDFSVNASAASGNVSNVDASELAGGFVTSSTASKVEAKSTTTTQIHGVRFDTNPGAVVTVDAAVGGVKDGAFLFFVQDGKVNGGFTGKLTNPLQLQGTLP